MTQNVQHKAGAGWDVTKDIASAGVEGGKMSLALLEKLASWFIPAAVGIPLVGGAALGMASSKITSPSKEDLATLEKRMINARVRTMIEENRRKQKAKDRELGIM